MPTIDELLLFVKSQSDYQQSRAEHYGKSDDSIRQQEYQKRADMFCHVLYFIDSNKPIKKDSLYITAEDLVGLPQELIDALNITPSDKKDFLIADIIKELGGIAMLDKIMIAIYRKTGEIETRTKLTARIYRMINKGLVFAHPSKKGVYTSKKLEKSEFDEEKEEFDEID